MRLLQGLVALLGAWPATAQTPLCREIYQPGEMWSNCRVQIGGLAIQGADAFMNALAPTYRDYLTEVLNATHGLEFEALPLNFDQTFNSVSANQLDYIYSNPAVSVCLMVEYGVTAVASLLNFRAGNSLDKFAGVIFARADSNFSTVEDLRQARVSAVSIAGLGAMQLQQAELLRQGINIMTDVVRLEFAYNQGKIVNDVFNGFADVGFVRTDMIDRQVIAGRHTWESFKVLNEIEDDGFPFSRSTDFTPEWPVCGLPHVPPDVNELVATALFRLDRFSSDTLLSAPAITGNFATWQTPMNYFGLLGMLEGIGYYSPSQGRCLRNANVYDAILCPDGFVKQTEERAFCSECRDGYTCLCNPCAQVRDPALVLHAEAVATTWSGRADVQQIQNRTLFTESCERMAMCGRIAVGQRIKFVLVDYIGAAGRAQINLPLIDRVEMRLTFNGAPQRMAVENITVDGMQKEQYTLEADTDTLGERIVQVLVNGEQAEMSPVILQSFEVPIRVIQCPPGYAVADNGDCTICPVGTFSELNDDGNARCRPCPEGRFNNLEGQPQCTMCPPGTAAATTGQVACQDCPAGRSTRGFMGFTACDACEPGQFAPEGGMARCEACTRGSYVPTIGAVACQECGYRMTTEDRGSVNASQCACPQDSYLAVRGDGVQECKACGTGVSCPSFASTPLLDEGFYMAPDSPRDAWELDVWLCQSKLSCPGQTTINDPVCANNLQGLNCAQCPDAHYKSGVRCIPCTSAGAFLLPVAMLLIFLAAGAMILKLGAQANRRTVFLNVTVAIGVFFMQVVGIFGNMRIVWPLEVHFIFSLSSLLLLDIDALQPACSLGTNFELDYLTGLIVPICLAMLFLAWHPLSRTLNKISCLKIQGKVFPKFKIAAIANTIGMVVQALFISIVGITVSLFNCYYGPNEKDVLRAYPYALCSGSRYTSLIPAFCFAVLIYIVCYLAALVWVAVKAPTLYVKQAFRTSTIFFIAKFHAKAWWYGLVIMFRSFCIAMVTVASPNDGFMQFVMLAVILTVSLVVHLIIKPYESSYANRMEVVQLCILLAIICLGSRYIEQVEDDASDKTAPILMTICFVAMGVLWLCCFVSAGYIAAMKDRFKKLNDEEVIELNTAASHVAGMIGGVTEDKMKGVLSACGHHDRRIMREVFQFLSLELAGLSNAKDMRAMRLPLSVERVEKVYGKVEFQRRLSVSSSGTWRSEGRSERSERHSGTEFSLNPNQIVIDETQDPGQQPVERAPSSAPMDRDNSANIQEAYQTHDTYNTMLTPEDAIDEDEASVYSA